MIITGVIREKKKPKIDQIFFSEVEERLLGGVGVERGEIIRKYIKDMSRNKKRYKKYL